MAAGILQEPGSKYGPCAEPCGHRDCAATRRQAEATCPRCGKPIGYGVRFYAHPMVHADCEEDAVDAGRPPLTE